MSHPRDDLLRTGMFAVAGTLTNRLAKAAVRLAAVGAVAMASAGAAPSQAPQPYGTIQGTDAAVTHLPQGVGAFTYWLHGADGEVVTFIRASNGSADASAKDGDFVVRFATVLAPGQTQTIAIPGIDWGNPPTIRIRRLGQTIEVTSSNTERQGNNL